MVVRAVKILRMINAGVDMVPATLTTHEVFLAATLLIREGSEGLIVGEPEILMEEGDISPPP
jgi:hypothetical protein